jgi:hypothetical protein
VERAEIILMAAGLVLPVIFAPLVVIAQRRLFSIFFTEGVDVLGNIAVARKDALLVGALMAKLNVLVLLVAWLALFTCRCFEQPVLLLASIALSGILAAITVTTLIVHTNVRRLNANTVIMVGLIVFTGGNLPLIVVTAALMALFRVPRLWPKAKPCIQCAGLRAHGLPLRSLRRRPRPAGEGIAVAHSF